MPNPLGYLSTHPRLRLIASTVVFLLIAFALTRPFLSSTSSSSDFPAFPQDVSFKYPAEAHKGAIVQSRPKRVAIIGAGASGSSAAFFLRRAARVMEERIGVEEGRLVGDIVVYEKEGYVGGRSTTVYPHGDVNLRPIELGASIFVDANRQMVKAAKHFNLTLINPDFGETGIGIWDGVTFLYTTGTSTSYFSSFWDTLSALRRYGLLSPYRNRQAVSALLYKFNKLYKPRWLSENGVSRSIEEFTERIGLGKELTKRIGEEWALRDIGVGKEWMGEIMEGSTRCNYASDMSQIHALGAGVSMATGGAKAVQGGNWRIFDKMLDDARVTIHLGTQVTDVVPLDEGFRVETNTSSIDDDHPFDVVFVAAPWHSTHATKSLSPYLAEAVPHQKYVRLHVTLFSTTRPAPSPEFFGMPSDQPVPSTILTTGYTSRTSGSPPPRFQSITWHGETYQDSGEYVVKIFSLTYINDRIVSELIGGEEPGWILRKEWDSYPELRPIKRYAEVEPVKGVQYLGALEPWVSTMETQTLSGREAVARVVEDWWGLGMGECKGGGEAWDWTCTP